MIHCTEPVKTFDTSYHADLRYASENNCLISHPMFSEKPQDCTYEIPGFSPIVVPGLSESVFHSPVMTLYLPSGKLTPFKCIKLPGLHVLLNQALKASINAAVYDWERFQISLESELLAMLGQVINTKASRTQEGDGFMALAQANPNQPLTTIGLGYELARDMARLCRRKDKNFTINDLNGLLVRVTLRFPATRASGILHWMQLRVIGRGRCCWLHPEVLKDRMLGDVDGDAIFSETDPKLRHSSYDPFVSIEIPSQVTSIQGTIKLSEIQMHEYDKKSIYLGLTGKEAIGQVTNMFYRSVTVAHKHFQWSKESREEFLTLSGHEDKIQRLTLGQNEEEQRQLFRYLSTEILIDCFAPLYEACFDARKDITLMAYVTHVLDAIRDPKNSPLNFEYLGTMIWDGKPIALKALKLIWDECDGQFIAELDSLPVQALFFEGESDNPKRQARIAQIITLLGDAPAQRIWAGLNNQEMEKID